MSASSVTRLNAALPPLDRVASAIAPSFAKSCRAHSSRTTPLISSSTPQYRPPNSLSRSYASIPTHQPTAHLTIPHQSTSAHHRNQPFAPPTLAQIQSNLPLPQNPRIPKLHVGTVSRTGTMSKTVQITFNTQRFDAWLKRYSQRPTRILAHEPTGYLRIGDVVEFARFTPATMAERYESGKLERRGGGVRWEVHRVVTPFGERVEDRKELEGKGELWERLGDVEFDRRKAELERVWNKHGTRRKAILKGMFEALELEVERMRGQLGLKLDNSTGVEQAARPTSGDNATTPNGEAIPEVSDAQKDIAAELQRLQQGSPSA